MGGGSHSRGVSSVSIHDSVWNSTGEFLRMYWRASTRSVNTFEPTCPCGTSSALGGGSGPRRMPAVSASVERTGSKTEYLRARRPEGSSEARPRKRRKREGIARVRVCMPAKIAPINFRSLDVCEKFRPIESTHSALGAPLKRRD